MKLRNPLFAFALVSVLGACGASDSEDEQVGVAAAEDALTVDESAAGATWQDVETDDPTAQLTVEPIDPSMIVDADGFTPPEIEDLNQVQSTKCHRVTGYSHGNPFKICVVRINGKLVERRTAHAYLQMRHAAAQAGVHLYVVSGFRTMKQQRHLYWLYKHGQGNLAAPPGYSNHQSGHALDLNTSAPGVYHWLANHGAAYGFKRTVPSEAWHWERW